MCTRPLTICLGLLQLAPPKVTNSRNTSLADTCKAISMVQVQVCIHIYMYVCGVNGVNLIHMSRWPHTSCCLVHCPYHIINTRLVLFNG